MLSFKPAFSLSSFIFISIDIDINVRNTTMCMCAVRKVHKGFASVQTLGTSRKKKTLSKVNAIKTPKIASGNFLYDTGWSCGAL